ncbi:hypothetical protein BGZ97_007117 [Linnemannia gamsii]|uniref:HCP-like protein n=1 Tax=Linnemannia gamsii TaxID=64522 RepID=A0A9P6UE95_9FUNG|nr:hypothetical protein BGZ97_007117 [Linnemannia gamsii]
MHKAIADQLQVGRDQADDDAAAAMPGPTATPRSTAPTADYTFRAPQSYGQGSFVLPAPVHNPTNNSQPRAPQLTTDSFEQTRANAEYGDVQAQVRLGMMYMQMEGREQHEEAVLWFFKAALRGDAEGQCRVGEMSMKGLGVPQDYRAAIYWFNQAAEQRNANALYYMGNLYSEGLGVSQSDHDAVIWYIRAASEGSAEAQNMMGFRHEIGLGMSRNQSMALEWYLKAAVQGHAGAEESVARLGRNEPPPKDSRKLTSILIIK